jgi:1A family penicillin-binding protein
MSNKFQFSYLGGKRSRRKSSFQPKNWLGKIALALFVLFITGFVIGGSVILFIFKSVAKDLPNPNQLKQREVAQSTKIFDRTGEHLLYEIHGEEKRTLVKFEDIPKVVINSAISAEDHNFYNHQGIDFRGLLRAIYKDVFHGKFEGGSSITQQLVKNTLLSKGTTTWQKIQRKFREWILAYQIEKKFSKEEILQMYLNEIPFGSNAYGVESAAKTFFGKSIKDVSIAESALLLSLPNKPTRYSPYGSNTKEMKARQEWVLRQMLDEKYITEEEYKNALAEKLVFSDKKQIFNAPHFVMYVKEYLSQKYGEQTLEQGGLKIITTLDWDKQEIAQKVMYEKTKDYPEKYNASNSALLSLDTKTGQILAMIGSRDYYNDEIDGQVNIVTSPRQPGSSFKPLVYATAFAKGFTPDTILFDAVTEFKAYPKNYTPHNYSNNENGPVTIRKALAGSLNIPAVKAIYLAGIDKVLDFADNLGYTTLKDRSRFGLSLVLGGGEVKMIEHLNAFATFATEGEYKETTPILKIEDGKGNTLEEFKLKTKKKFDSQIARQISDVLSDNNARAYVFGANNFLNLGERPVGAKSGTTNDYRDAWTIGYTPSIATAVWVGNNDFSEMKTRADGGIIAAPIWQEFMKQILKDTPIEQFTKPEPAETSKPILNSEYKVPYVVKIDRLSGKLATEFTPPEYIEEKTFFQFHNILHYLDKDDPKGDSNGQNDEQYNNWEVAVQRWVKEQSDKLTAEGKENPYLVPTPPTEVDDTHTSDKRPTISFDYPLDNETITSREFKSVISFTTPGGAPDKVKYYLDGKLLKMTTQPPLEQFTFTFEKITNGFHILKAEIYDSNGNFNFTEINLNLLLPSQGEPLTVQWLGPLPNSQINLAEMPTKINIQLSDYTQTKKVEIYANDKIISTMENFNSDNLIIDWQETEIGTYNLFAKVYSKDGGVVESLRSEVEVK